MRFFLLCSFLLCSFLFVQVSHAATLFVRMPDEVLVGTPFTIDFFLDSEGETYNALSATIPFPDGISLQRVTYGNSFLHFWTVPPENREHSLVFSGIAPGGFLGESGEVVSVEAVADSLGIYTLAFADTTLLRHDGLGTQDPLFFSGATFAVTPDAPPLPAQIEDEDLPEAFVPVISSSPELFDGQWFLVFATQDKGSGVSYYEVCEGRSRCVRAESPYALRYQALDRAIVVKAFDTFGNVRIVELAATYPSSFFARGGYVMIGVILVLLFGFFLWRKRGFHF